MKLPLSFSKEKKKEFFLALVLRNEKINAIFFEESEGKMHVLGKHAENFKNSLEETSFEELLETADKAVSTAEQYLPQKIETVKTIFGVKGSWVEENKIKKDYLAKLKKISDELGLIPIGFLVIFEAIAYLLEKEEGAPVTTILAETGEKFVSAALIKAGKIKEFKTSEIVESPASALDNILKHFSSSDVLPARIIIFNGDEDESQEFMNHTWSKSLPFLHTPQVTALPFEFDTRAVLYGAAIQLGFEVLSEEMPSEEEEEISNIEPGKEPVREEITDEKIRIIPDASSLEYFGFVEGEDISKVKTQEVLKETPEDLSSRFDSPRDEAGSAERAGEAEIIDEIPEEVKEEEGTKRQLPSNAFAILTGAQKIIPKLLKSFIPSPPGMPLGGKILVIPAVLILILAVISFFYFFSNKATVVLDISARPQEKTQNVTFASEGASDPANGVLSSQFLSVTEDGTVSMAATGKKEVGDKAKGTVTIFNNESSSQTLSSGTTITSANGLEFTLDKGVKVSSASGDIFSGTTPGKEKVSVSAKKIGQEYNLPSNTKFTIGNNSSIAAKNDDAFSGGTKKDVTVVSSGDIKKLKDTLPKNLEDKAREDLSKKISGDDVLLPVLVSEELVKKDFSKKEDDEASQVSLIGTVQYKGISYKKSDKVSFANEVLKNDISSGETIDPNSLSVNVSNIEQDQDKVSGKISIKGFAVPKIDGNAIAKQISGKSFANAREIIIKLPQVADAKINLSFNLPFLPQRLPFSSKNITITRKINE